MELERGRERVGVVSGGLWALGFRLLGALSGVLLVMLVARVLSQADTGRYFSLLSLVSIAALVAGCGAGTAAVKLVAQAVAAQHPARVRGVIDAALLLLLAGCALVGGVLALPWTRAFLQAQMNLTVAVSFPLIWLWIGASALQTLLAEMFRGLQKLFLASAFGGTASTLLALILLLGLRVTAGAEGLTLNRLILVVALANLIGVAAAGACLFAVARRLGPQVSRAWPELLGLSAPLWATQIVLGLLLQADIWILQSAGDAAAVALYGTAVRMTLLLTLPLTVLNAALMPVIAARHAQGRRAELQTLLRDTASLAALPALGATALFALAGHTLLSTLFGRFYAAALPLLLILSLGQLVNILCGSAGYTLMMTGRQREMMWITLLFGALLVIGGCLVVHRLGAPGLAGSAALCLAGQSIAMWLRVHQTRGLWTHASLRAMRHPFATLGRLR